MIPIAWIGAITGRAWAWLQSYVTAILVTLLISVGGFAAFQTVRLEGVSIFGWTFEGWKSRATKAETRNRFLADVINQSEDNRKTEREQARTSYQSLRDRCTRQRRQALNAAKIIKEIVDEPLQETADGPRRPSGIITADRLRAVVGQPGIGATGGLPAGDDGLLLPVGAAGATDGGDTEAGDAGGAGSTGGVPDVAG